MLHTSINVCAAKQAEIEAERLTPNIVVSGSAGGCGAVRQVAGQPSRGALQDAPHRVPPAAGGICALAGRTPSRRPALVGRGAA